MDMNSIIRSFIFSAGMILAAALLCLMTACTTTFAEVKEQTTASAESVSSGPADPDAAQTEVHEETADPDVSAPVPAVDMSIFAIQPAYDYASAYSDYGTAIVGVSGDSDLQYGFIDEKGDYLLEPAFDGFIGSYGQQWMRYGDFGANGYVWVEKDGKWGFVNEKCKMIAEPQYDNAAEFGSNGLAGVCVDNKWGFINETGKIVIQPQFDGVGVFYDNGLAVFYDGDKCGLINDKGEVIADAIYDYINFSGDVSEYGLYSDNGQGLLWVHSGEKCGLLNTHGDVIADVVYDNIFTFGENGLARMCRDGKFGFINEQGKEIVPPVYDDAYGYADNGLAAVANYFGKDYDPSSADVNQKIDVWKWGFIDAKGKVVIPLQFIKTSGFGENGLAAVCVDAVKIDINAGGNAGGNDAADHVQQWAYINKNGEYVIEPQPYAYASSFRSDGLASVTVDDKVGLINEAGEFVIEPQFDFGYTLIPSASGTYPVSKNGSWGLISQTGEFLIAPRFDGIMTPNPASDEGPGIINRTGLDLASVSENGRTGIITLDGRILLEPVSEDPGLIISSNGMAAILYNGKYGYIKLAE